MSPKTVLIIGANRGMGLAFAQQYSQRGWTVHGTYRKESRGEAEELLKLASKTYELDLIDEVTIKAASQAFGAQPLDLLINCAAGGNGPDRLEDTTADEMMRNFRITTVGPLLTTKAFLPQLKQSQKAVIANISSNAGSISDNGSGGNLSYRVAKAALNMLSVNTAHELAPDGIACIALHPGWVKTKMSGFTGHMGPDEAVTRMLKVLDGIDMSKTGRFYHRDGHELTW